MKMILINDEVGSGNEDKGEVYEGGVDEFVSKRRFKEVSHKKRHIVCKKFQQCRSQFGEFWWFP